MSRFASTLCSALLASILAASGLAASGCSSTPTRIFPGGDGGVCDPDAGACGGCLSDISCTRDRPRCDTVTGKCQPCLPTNDNCATGTRCTAVNDTFACSAVCKVAADCPKANGTLPDCCGGTCIDTSADTKNCGACGKTCQAINNGVVACSAGACAVGSCNKGFADCNKMAADGCEADTTKDAKNCGACGTGCPTGPNATPACQMSACAIACAPGFDDCDKNAANGCETPTDSDLKNCGACQKTCAIPANATSATCVKGMCGAGDCKFGFADCDMKGDNGCEADLLSPSSCGACNVNCPTPANAVPGCKAGVCGIGACKPLFGDCDNDATNGCERNLSTDLNNCGGCNSVCQTANATPLCLNGKCGIASCAQGFADCDMSAANGCEAMTQSDINNCGGCGKVCAGAPNAIPTCNFGGCTVFCAKGYGNCDNNLQNGCETNIGMDPANCGSCGASCPQIANATRGCGNYQCTIGACSPGYADCNGVVGDGCEINVKADVKNCGSCNNICITPNAQAACTNGQCAIMACSTGYADCDGNAINGCEVNTQTSPNNCNGCGNVCPSGPNATGVCSNGGCGLTCAFGYGDCDMIAANGCETKVLSDLNNCGACNKVCGAVPNGSPTCTGGACKVASCSQGFGDCDGVVANGCETDLTSSPTNCNACGNACAFANAQPGCTNSQCNLKACNTNYGNCDGNAANGCETNLLTSSANCGACGKSCNGQPCANGVCSACKVATGVKSIAGGAKLYGFCWYLGAKGITCDAVCAELGGMNMTVAAQNSFPDSCNGASAADISTYFFQNGNACGFVSGVGSTGYHSLGYGYFAANYYGKCATGGSAGVGAYPGDTNNSATRCLACPCF